MMALLMGMRTSEILHCTARDVDDRGRLLWIRVSKTTSGRRVLAIPAELRAHLLRIATGRHPLERLFPHRREWLYQCVHRICDRAGTPLICTHSLRGLHATLAIDAGVTPPAVASALGHASVRATLVSYADASTVAHARQRRVVSALRAGKNAGKPAARPAVTKRERARN